MVFQKSYIQTCWGSHSLKPDWRILQGYGAVTYPPAEIPFPGGFSQWPPPPPSPCRMGSGFYPVSLRGALAKLEIWYGHSSPCPWLPPQPWGNLTHGDLSLFLNYMLFSFHRVTYNTLISIYSQDYQVCITWWKCLALIASQNWLI